MTLKQANPAVPRRKLMLILGLLLAVSWLPSSLLLAKTTLLAAEASGGMLVVFPLHWNAEQTFKEILQAQGSVIARTGFASIWIVHSARAGFVGRLKARGAWFALDPIVLDPASLLSCSYNLQAN
jgi:hypothetical protein